MNCLKHDLNDFAAHCTCEECEESTKAWLDAERKATRAKKCEACGKQIKPMFKATPDPLDWLFNQCDTCLEDFCKDCCTDDGNGKSECVDCYTQRKHFSKKGQPK